MPSERRHDSSPRQSATPNRIIKSTATAGWRSSSRKTICLVQNRERDLLMLPPRTRTAWPTLIRAPLPLATRRMEPRLFHPAGRLRPHQCLQLAARTALRTRAPLMDFWTSAIAMDTRRVRHPCTAFPTRLLPRSRVVLRAQLRPTSLQTIVVDRVHLLPPASVGSLL